MASSTQFLALFTIMVIFSSMIVDNATADLEPTNTLANIIGLPQSGVQAEKEQADVGTQEDDFPSWSRPDSPRKRTQRVARKTPISSPADDQ